MAFKTAQQIKDIIEGGVYSCGAHNFYCDAKDTESIKKHEEEFQHTVSGTSICIRCRGVNVTFKGIPKPKIGTEPGALCDDCKKALVAEVTGGSA